MLAKEVLEPATRAGVLVLPVLGPEQLEGEARLHLSAFWQTHAPSLSLVAGSAFPEHYAFRRDGVFFAVLHSAAPDADAEILRLHGVLGQATADPSRVVLSELPLAPFTEEDRGHLSKAYRVYEILARYGTTVLASGHYGLTYLGMYGGLHVASAGRLNGTCDALPDGRCTPPAVVVLDFLAGRLKTAFAVEMGPEPRLLPAGSLPRVLQTYRRWDP